MKKEEKAQTILGMICMAVVAILLTLAHMLFSGCTITQHVNGYSSEELAKYEADKYVSGYMARCLEMEDTDLMRWYCCQDYFTEFIQDKKNFNPINQTKAHAGWCDGWSDWRPNKLKTGIEKISKLK